MAYRRLLGVFLRKFEVSAFSAVILPDPVPEALWQPSLNPVLSFERNDLEGSGGEARSRTVRPIKRDTEAGRVGPKTKSCEEDT